ncbi:hypothetical protein TEQG_05717 [Trichophyton equinum CBS 127.97]|uniref:Uncharacterized protein n=1 Tax=Trichophyton equinum (strain ATCC MYA-4606 / CBS 127.97) TaxID=559882 RepID=F2PXV4_TRIEC|nr:hypothetical protein TEQG_05717 [Trichophyton equinum CBS 127.97]
MDMYKFRIPLDGPRIATSPASFPPWTSDRWLRHATSPCFGPAARQWQPWMVYSVPWLASSQPACGAHRIVTLTPFIQQNAAESTDKQPVGIRVCMSQMLVVREALS